MNVDPTTLGLLIVVAFIALTGSAAAICYAWLRHRRLFAKMSGLAKEVSEIRESTIAPISDRIAKLEILSDIQNTRGDPDPRRPRPRFTAQFGEDLVIYDFFQNSPPGFFVEAGAYDGEFVSNTWLLESLGWNGLLVEPHPRMAEACRQNRPCSIVKEVALGPANASGTVDFTCADSPEGGAVLSFLEAESDHIERCLEENCTLTKVSVPYTSLTTLLEPITDSLEFLSLDVEGGELSILKGLDFHQFAPRMIVVEQQGRDTADELRNYLFERNYRLLTTRGCNEIFVARSS